ncbi:MAG: sulfur carrier protein ThiS [Hyphococcus sp.]
MKAPTYTKLSESITIWEEFEFPMNIVVNGEEMTVSPAISVAELLGSLSIEPRKIAVERNLEIVPKSLYADTAVCDGDRIEIVQFVGGG